MTIWREVHTRPQHTKKIHFFSHLMQFLLKPLKRLHSLNAQFIKALQMFTCLSTCRTHLSLIKEHEWFYCVHEMRLNNTQSSFQRGKLVPTLAILQLNQWVIFIWCGQCLCLSFEGIDRHWQWQVLTGTVQNAWRVWEWLNWFISIYKSQMCLFQHELQ